MSQRSCTLYGARRSVIECDVNTDDDKKTFLTHYSPINGVDYIFGSFDRYLSGDESDQLHQKYFESHRKMTAPDRMAFY
jgi:TctA family transporter